MQQPKPRLLMKGMPPVPVDADVGEAEDVAAMP